VYYVSSAAQAPLRHLRSAARLEALRGSHRVASDDVRRGDDDQRRRAGDTVLITISVARGVALCDAALDDTGPPAPTMRGSAACGPAPNAASVRLSPRRCSPKGTSNRRQDEQACAPTEAAAVRSAVSSASSAPGPPGSSSLDRSRAPGC
jgi:hypothetical protein